MFNFRYLLLWNLIGCFSVGLVIYLSLSPNIPNIVSFRLVDKLEHLFAYGFLMGWFCQIYVHKKYQLVLAVLFCLMGVSLEILQDLGGSRYFEYADMVANTAGVFLGWWLSRGWCAGWLFRADQALFRR